MHARSHPVAPGELLFLIGLLQLTCSYPGPEDTGNDARRALALKQALPVHFLI